MERITATYYIETPYAPEKAAAVLAGEQSSGTFVAVPGETEELKQRFAARVESVDVSSCHCKSFLEYRKLRLQSACNGFNLAGKFIRDHTVHRIETDGY